MAAIMPPSVGDGLGEDLAETGRGPAELVGGTNSGAHPGFVSSSFASYRHERVPTPTPPVGAYNLSGSMLRNGADVNQRGSSSLMSETRRHVRDLQRERQPGPGAYDPHLASKEAEARRLTTRARTRANETSAVPRPRDPLAPDPTPGPAHYAPSLLPSERQGGSHSAFRSGMDRLTELGTSGGPSPAEYVDLETRYNSGFTNPRYRTGSVAPASSSLMRPTKKEIPRGAMVDVVPGVPAPAAVAAAPRTVSGGKNIRVFPESNARASNEKSDALTARVANAAASRSRNKPGLPPNAPTPQGYSSFKMRGDEREANEYAYVTRMPVKRRESGLGLAGRAAELVSPSSFRAAAMAPVPHARPTPVPRMRPITGDAEIVEFYELSDRAFEKPGR
jgi:hypothetical protein